MHGHCIAFLVSGDDMVRIMQKHQFFAVGLDPVINKLGITYRAHIIMLGLNKLNRCGNTLQAAA